MRGKIDLFGLDALVNMAAAAGLHVEMRVLEAARLSRNLPFRALPSETGARRQPPIGR